MITIINIAHIPLALYIHIPWCVKKCPYCDFNSHEMKEKTDFAGYVDALIADAHSQVRFLQGRKISSIFIGGGTPSLLPIKEYHRLFSALQDIFQIDNLNPKDGKNKLEVTMEANPATIEHAPFEGYLTVGINRLSIGIQTFNSQQLEVLGRIHNAEQAVIAIQSAKKAGFQRINADLMHGLPGQTCEQALFDLHQAINAGATHISWYQLTIEKNTVFYRTQPLLPHEDTLGDIEDEGMKILVDNGFTNYEVSAWRGNNDNSCLHNVNYWQFGDYLAIGAGAHGKVTVADIDGYENGIYRFSKARAPKGYVNYKDSPKFVSWQAIKFEDIAGEFMLDALRLSDGVPMTMFNERTGLDIAIVRPKLTKFMEQGLLVHSDVDIKTTELGRRYLNRIVQDFI